MRVLVVMLVLLAAGALVWLFRPGPTIEWELTFPNETFMHKLEYKCRKDAAHVPRWNWSAKFGRQGVYYACMTAQGFTEARR
ncbi:MAG: hypothetical protein ACE5H5_00950 [Nitrospinota bacterium]